MLVVHDQIACRQRQRIDDVAALGGQPLALDGGGPVAGQVRLGDHDEVGTGEHHTVVQRALQHPDNARFRRRSGLQHRCGSVGFGQLLDNAVRRAGAGGDDDGVAARRDVRPQHREDLV